MDKNYSFVLQISWSNCPRTLRTLARDEPAKVEWVSLDIQHYNLLTPTIVRRLRGVSFLCRYSQQDEVKVRGAMLRCEFLRSDYFNVDPWDSAYAYGIIPLLKLDLYKTPSRGVLIDSKYNLIAFSRKGCGLWWTRNIVATSTSVCFGTIPCPYLAVGEAVRHRKFLRNCQNHECLFQSHFSSSSSSLHASCVVWRSMRLSSPRDRPWCGVLRNEVLVFVVALGFEKSTDFTDILKVCLFIEAD